MAIEAFRLYGTVGLDTRDAERGLQSLDERLNNAAKTLTMTGGLLTAGVTLPLVAAGKQALDTAAEFEQSMNVLQQVANASAEQMEMLSAQALQLGADTSFSAGEAAQAMLELAKAGMPVESVMSAISGVMDLAAAGGVQLATAANVTASALNAFGLEASQSTYVANLLAAAANASAADISDLAMGLQQGGFAFAATGQQIDDLVASLAILTNVGLTGSDAGTALKNAMTRLMAPTKEATSLMAQLGLVTTDYAAIAATMSESLGRRIEPTVDGVNGAFREYAILTGLATEKQKDLTDEFADFAAAFSRNRFFDEHGNMRSLAEIIGLLNTAMAGLTMEERNNALATIFLSDGMKAMIPLLEVGEDGFLAMKDAVNEEGAAARVAAARMSGLSGAIEYFKGSIDSFLIGTAQPYLASLASIIRAGADMIDTFGALNPNVRNAALAFLGVLAATGPVVAGLGAVAGALAFLLTSLGLVTAGTAVMAAAVAGNFWGVGDAVSNFAQSAVAFTGYLWDVITTGNTLSPWLAKLPAEFQPIANQIGITTAQVRNFGVELANLAAAEGVVSMPVLEQLRELPGVLGDVAVVGLGAWAALKGLYDVFAGSSEPTGNTGNWIRVLEASFGEDLGGRIKNLTIQLAMLRSEAASSFSALQGLDWSAKLDAALSTEIRWDDLRVNGAALIGRVGQELSNLDWSGLAVNFGGFLSMAGQRLTEQADAYLGEGNIITRTVDRIRGTLAALQMNFEGASIEQPLDLLERVINGAMGIYGLLGSVKNDVATTAITTLQTVLTEVLALTRNVTTQIDPAQVKQFAVNFVQGYTNALAVIFDDEKMFDLGSAAGALSQTIASKLTATLEDPAFGSQIGFAVGQATGAFLEGATAFVSGMAGQFDEVDYTSFQDAVDTFVVNFGQELLLGLYQADWSFIGTALRNLIAQGIDAAFGDKNALGFFPGPMGSIGQQAGEWMGMPTISDLFDMGDVIEQGFSRAISQAMGGDSMMQLAADKMLFQRLAGIETSMRTLEANMMGPVPKPRTGLDQVDAEEMDTFFGMWGATLGESAYNAFTSLFTWPEIDLQSMGFKWPEIEIPMPDWVRRLFGAAEEVERTAARAADIYDDIVAVANRVERNNSGGRSGGGGSSNPGGGYSVIDDEPDDPARPNIEFASVTAGVPPIQITGPIYINNDMDIEELAYEIIQRVRRAT